MAYYGNKKKLSNEMIQTIRQLVKNGVSQYKIAKELKTSQSIIAKIVNKVTYKDC